MLRRNVLIFHSGGLGDFTLTWPLGIALGRLHPTSRVIYVTQPSKGALAAAALGLDWQSIESGWHALYADDAQKHLDEKLLKTIQQAHSIYSFMSNEKDKWHANVCAISPATAVVPLSMHVPPNYAEHISGLLLAGLSKTPAVRGAVEQILLSISKGGLGKGAKAGGPIIVHPGSGGLHKCWPLDSFLSLIERLREAGRTVNVVVGEVESERLTNDQMKRLEAAAPLVNPATYVDLYQTLANSAAFIGNDSGPGHLAGIMGLPTLILFGGTNPAIWKPLGPKVKTLQNANLADLSVDEVYLAAKGL